MGETRRKRVVVTQHDVDCNDPGYTLLSRLSPFEFDPGTDNFHVVLLAYLLKTPEDFGTFYANPMFSVEAEAPTPDFYRAAKRAQLSWLMAFKRAYWAT